MVGCGSREEYANNPKKEGLRKTGGRGWVSVRPGGFTDGHGTGIYKHGFPPTEKNLKFKISRADVAAFMLRQLTDDTYLRRPCGLSY